MELALVCWSCGKEYRGIPVDKPYKCECGGYVVSPTGKIQGKWVDESTVYGKKLCARCRNFFRKQGEEICEPCMNELILGQPSRINAWNRFVEEFSDALVRADCRRK